MSDITVLVPPTSVCYNQNRSLAFNFARRSQTSLTTANRPVMVTLENVDSHKAPSHPVEVRALNRTLLSPPPNTFKASQYFHNIPRPPPSFAHPELLSHTLGSPDLPRGETSRRLPFPKRSSELRKPPPSLCKLVSVSRNLVSDVPLVRSTAFWRKTRRSGVTGASYSPSSFIIRRSTFIAAGLSLDKPRSDLSALGVESRISILVLGPDFII